MQHGVADMGGFERRRTYKSMNFAPNGLCYAVWTHASFNHLFILQEGRYDRFHFCRYFVDHRD